MSEVQDINIVKETASTELCVETIWFTWSVNNFSLCSQFSRKKICSPEFTVLNIPFEVNIHVTEDKDADQESVSINLYKLKEDGKDQHIKYRIGLVDDKNICHAVDREMLFTDKCRTGHGLQFKTRNMTESIYCNDQIKIHVELKVLNEKVLNFPKSKAKSLELIKKATERYNTQRRLHGYVRLYIFSPILLLCILALASFPFAVHDFFISQKECALYHQEVNQLLIDSSRKLMYIGKALNLSDVTMMASEFIASYFQKLDLTILESPMMSINVTNLQ